MSALESNRIESNQIRTPLLIGGIVFQLWKHLLSRTGTITLVSLSSLSLSLRTVLHNPCSTTCPFPSGLMSNRYYL